MFNIYLLYVGLYIIMLPFRLLGYNNDLCQFDFFHSWQLFIFKPLARFDYNDRQLQSSAKVYNLNCKWNAHKRRAFHDVSFIYTRLY